MTNPLEDTWKKAKTAWRHLDPNTTNVQRNIENLKTELSHIKNAKTMIDWGPGGGYLSKYIADYHKTIQQIDYVDIVDDHFDLINSTLKNITTVKGHKLTKLNTLKLPLKPDILICYSVLYHMPSIKYLEEVGLTPTPAVTPSAQTLRTYCPDGRSPVRLLSQKEWRGASHRRVATCGCCI